MSRPPDRRLTGINGARGRAFGQEEQPCSSAGILVGTDDAKRMTDYYRKVFGEPRYEDGEYSTWLFGDTSISIGAHSEVSGKNAQPGRLIWNLETTDVRGEFDRLKSAGAIVVKRALQLRGVPGRVDRHAGRTRTATTSSS